MKTHHHPSLVVAFQYGRGLILLPLLCLKLSFAFLVALPHPNGIRPCVMSEWGGNAT